MAGQTLGRHHRSHHPRRPQQPMAFVFDILRPLSPTAALRELAVAKDRTKTLNEQVAPGRGGQDSLGPLALGLVNRLGHLPSAQPLQQPPQRRLLRRPVHTEQLQQRLIVAHRFGGVGPARSAQQSGHRRLDRLQPPIACSGPSRKLLLQRRPQTQAHRHALSQRQPAPRRHRLGRKFNLDRLDRLLLESGHHRSPPAGT